jgi:hypothetical protein
MTTIKLAILLACLLAGPALASMLNDPEAWTALRHPTRPDARFAFAEGVARMRGNGALGVRYRSAPPGMATLAWRWRVDAAPPRVRHDVRGADDRAVAVHLWFDDGEDAADQRYGPLLRMLGYPRVTHALTYVWGGPQPVGTVLVSPYHARGRLIVLRNDAAPEGAWLEEIRDVAADVRRAFGPERAPRGAPRWVALSTDGDDTAAVTEAAVADLTAGP